MYTHPLSGVIQPTGILYHFFADDSHFNDSSVPSEVSHLAEKISGTVARVSDWMVENKLKMNEDKTEIIQIGTRNNVSKVESTDSLFITNCQVLYVHVVRNLEVFFDSTLFFDPHISQLCKGLDLQLHRLDQIRAYLTTESTKKLAVAFLSSRRLIFILGFSIERMIAVCLPFHVSRIVTLSRMKCIIISIVLYNVLFKVPAVMRYDIELIEFDEYNNVTLPYITFTDFYNLNSYVILRPNFDSRCPRFGEEEKPYLINFLIVTDLMTSFFENSQLLEQYGDLHALRITAAFLTRASTRDY
ncbi:uncharacterized protein LOC129928105 [Biomphalaria glabrata]|uniref:Uncharacterized protein LOC129928105 n=1 Tax=Biomphalaria glabrata TaxID=6526 RepID=A0A9W3BCA0_BIOGL|nr:uncharacterized protein LOC129928105 [Biomphalaria glabrata]